MLIKNEMKVNLLFSQSVNKLSARRGQSIIEVIVAVAILIIIAATSMIAILGAFSSGRLAKEETKAAFLATEGLEAVQSIRNQDWDSLVNGDHGLANTSGTWVFSGTSDIDLSGKFTRVIAISDVQRDSNDDIVESGGTIDPDTKKIEAAIDWSFTSTRQNSVTMTTYLTNWQTGKYVYPGSSSACGVFCESLGYSGGTCRGGVPQCTANGETSESQGNRYCSNEAQGATCCCAP